MGLNDADMEVEEQYWKDYVATRIPVAYPGIKEIMEEQKRRGGYIAVVSHSMENTILRDYKENGLPEPDLVYGWGRPANERKPYPFPLMDIMEKLNLNKEDLLMIDDLKPGYDMAKECGVDFAAASWAYDIPEVADFMRANDTYFFNTIDELRSFLFDDWRYAVAMSICERFINYRC